MDAASNASKAQPAQAGPETGTGSHRAHRGPQPWAALTKGECLLLALTLHRLRRQADQRSAKEEIE
jgi:hypothetical protein